MATIGERIRTARKKQNMTLDELAKKVGTSKQTIQRYETGIINNIPSDKIKAIAAILCTTPAFLIGWTEKSQITTLSNIDLLNDKGLVKVQEYINDLLLSDKYRKGE